MAVEEIPLGEQQAGDAEPALQLERGGLWRQALRQTFRKRSAVAGGVILGLLLFIALFAPVIAPYGEREVLIATEGLRPRAEPCIHLSVDWIPDVPVLSRAESFLEANGFSCPSDRPQHLMGLDGNGRDVFSRILYGARTSLVASVGAVGFAVVCGTVLGLVAGFFGGRIDNVVMRVMDVLLAFPALLLAIAIVTARGPGLFNAVLAVSVVTIPVYARVIRSRVLSVREQDFVAADRALGVSNARILVHRVLPNSLTPLVVQATLGMATAVLELAALSFFGLAGDPDTAEWGRMLSVERNQLFTSPHLVFYPGLMIMLNVLAFNLIGDGLRDALDPRLNS
ncbi:MAG: ABC transporter permease [Thermoanaerobacterales bacterium]|jgi:peptide/nickel transport system permease protein|nr:ABC transporter permease [Thermoanaerobacterales bacterium]